MKTSRSLLLLTCAMALLLAGCAKKNAGETTDGSTPETTVGSNDDFGNRGTDPNAANPAPGPGDDGEGLDPFGGRLQPVFFAFDKYDLTQESRDTLMGNARVLREVPGHDVIIEGHCDERGTNEYNLALGDRRARAARDFLVTSGIPSSRLTIVSYGEERPFAFGHTEADWSQNRRAHFRAQGGAGNR